MVRETTLIWNTATGWFPLSVTGGFQFSFWVGFGTCAIRVSTGKRMAAAARFSNSICSSCAYPRHIVSQTRPFLDSLGLYAAGVWSLTRTGPELFSVPEIE